MSKGIYLDAPNVGSLEKRYVNAAIDSGYVSSVGPFVREFEKRFSRLLGVNDAVSTQSGTSAIYMSLRELGIGKGDEVIVPALTFAATANPVVYVGARPVFVDVDIDTWNIDPEKMEGAITKNTKAVIPVHLYGNPCPMNEINRIAKRRKLYVIEDATESLGAKYEGRDTGAFGDFGCFSFNGNKVITTGGGGMIVGKGRKGLEHIRFLVNQAKENRPGGYYHPEIGFNYRMTNVEAALGLAQLDRLNGFLSRKRKFYAIYRNELGTVPLIKFQEDLENAESSRWLTCVTLDEPVDIGLLQKKLDREGVPTRRIFMPLTEFPHYRSSRRGSLDNSYYIHKRGLCLPGSTLNSNENIYNICKVIRTQLKRMSI